MMHLLSKLFKDWVCSCSFWNASALFRNLSCAKIGDKHKTERRMNGYQSVKHGEYLKHIKRDSFWMLLDSL